MQSVTGARMDAKAGPPELLAPLCRTAEDPAWPCPRPRGSPRGRTSTVLGTLAVLGLGLVTLTYLLWQVPLPRAWHQHPEEVSPESWEALEGEAGQQRDSCQLVLVESIPQDLPSAAGSPSAQPLAQAWLQLLDTAQESIHVASYYWSLTGPDIGVNDSSSQPVHPWPPPLSLRLKAAPTCPWDGHTESQGTHLCGALGPRPRASAMVGTGKGQGKALSWELWAGWRGGPWGSEHLDWPKCNSAPSQGHPDPWPSPRPWAATGPGGRDRGPSWGPPLMASVASQGEAILQKLQQLLDKDISLMVATNSPSLTRNSTDLQVLAAHGAQVRQVPMRQFTGGVLHSKFWVVDGRHIYVGSANMDWRSLTQVKELGAIIYNCSRLAQDLEKTFQTYWVLGAPQAVLPKTWPQNFSSHINRFQPLRGHFDGLPTMAYFSASPPALCPRGRTQDLDAVLAVMEGAREFIFASVMEYFPTTRFSHPARYWPVLDNALREAAFGRRVRVRLLVSCGLGTDPTMFPYLRSLQAISNPSAGISVDVKVFIVPVGNHSNIPFSRVNHNKFLVTEKAAYIGTSNWSEDYFSSTSGVGLVVSQRAPGAQAGVQPAQEQLRRLFERDWSSRYAVGLDGQAPGQDCVWQG